VSLHEHSTRKAIFERRLGTVAARGRRFVAAKVRCQPQTSLDASTADELAERRKPLICPELVTGVSPDSMIAEGLFCG
jgi:hypothetical protein